jgi:hypothetical protein
VLVSSRNYYLFSLIRFRQRRISGDAAKLVCIYRFFDTKSKWEMFKNLNYISEIMRKKYFTYCIPSEGDHGSTL